MLIHDRFIAPALLLAGLVSAGCAVEETTRANEDEKMYLEAWISTHHPDAERMGMGIYVIGTDTEGADAALSVTKPCYAFVTYTVRDLEGNVSDTNDPEVAMQTGEYDPEEQYAYYGPEVWYVEDNNIYKGVEDMMVGLPVGSTREAVIPGWLQTYNRFDTEDTYMSEITDRSPLVYTVRVDGVTNDIMQWQKDRMKDKSSEYAGGSEPVFEGFYFYSDPDSGEEPEDDSEDDSEENIFHKDTTIYINYTGRLLNGQAFDTTVKKIAKDNRIFSESKEYGPIEVTMSADSTEIQLDGSSVISGFSSTLWRISRPFEKCTGMFWSSLGYGYSGSGTSIPGYAPLVFEIELVADPDPEEEEEE